MWLKKEASIRLGYVLLLVEYLVPATGTRYRYVLVAYVEHRLVYWYGYDRYLLTLEATDCWRVSYQERIADLDGDTQHMKGVPACYFRDPLLRTQKEIMLPQISSLEWSN
jgi:hypothetical protein